MKRLGAFIFFMLISINCFGAIASVGYIHNTIRSEKNIGIPVRTEMDHIAGLSYLMRQIDAANATLGRTTNYADDAITNVVSAERGLTDIKTLIFVPEFNVQLTGISANATFSFQMSAMGNFTIDWGDGTAPQVIRKTNVTNTTYSHKYVTAGNYTVGLMGDATGYIVSTVSNTSSGSAISFANSANKTKITGISGSLGAIFPTIGDGSAGGAQPRFYQTFSGLSKLTGAIPTDLFAGISGASVAYMFARLFQDCPGLTGAIPADLFAGISGAPTQGIFLETFKNCTGLTSIPTGLFARISGVPARIMFDGTFSGCTGLTGAIPSGLFGAFTGAPAAQMFQYTFYNCSKITTIEDGIWDLSGLDNTSESLMFNGTFAGMTSLTSPAPTIAAGNPTNLWGKFTVYAGQLAFEDDTNMSGYTYIPKAWGGGLQPPEFSVQLTGMSANSIFSFQMTAMGTFVIDWGDGTAPQTITRTDTGRTTYSHTYADAGNYTVGFTGDATGYSLTTVAAISFEGFTKITGISGSLGAVFSTIGTGATRGQQPAFYYTFAGCTGLTGAIPAGLFTGISGAPMLSMFAFTFSGCAGLTGAIPAGLFAGITGASAIGVFNNTFAGCTGLTGTIPAGLFAGIAGTPSRNAFNGTFSGCTKISGIENGLMSVPNISFFNGSGVFPNMFAGVGTDASVSTITMDAANVFTGIDLTVDNPSTDINMFTGTGWTNKYTGYAAIQPNWK